MKYKIKFLFKSIIIFIVILVILILLAFIVSSDLTEEQRNNRYTRTENDTRILFLKQLCGSVLFYVKETGNEPEKLFSVLSYLHENRYTLPVSITMPDKYRDDPCFIDDFLKNDLDFTQKSDYKIISINDNKWGIIELRCGEYGKYYFIIDQEGKVHKIEGEYFDAEKIENDVLPFVDLSKMLKNGQANNNFKVSAPPPPRK